MRRNKHTRGERDAAQRAVAGRMFALGLLLAGRCTNIGGDAAVGTPSTASVSQTSLPASATPPTLPLWLVGRAGQVLRFGVRLPNAEAGDGRLTLEPLLAPAAERTAQDSAIEPAAQPEEPLFALTRVDEYLAWASGAGRIWHTSDAGRSWSIEATPVRDALLGLSFSSPLHGVAVGEHAALLSTEDGGSHWRALDEPQRRRDGSKVTWRAVKLARQSGTALIAGDQGTLLRSTDAGRTWTALSLGVSEDLLAVDVTADGTLGVVVGRQGRAFLIGEGGEQALALPKNDWNAVRLLPGASSAGFAPVPRVASAAGTNLTEPDPKNAGVTLIAAGTGGALQICALDSRECRSVSGGPADDFVAMTSRQHDGGEQVFLLARGGTVWHLGPPFTSLEPLASLTGASLLDDLAQR